MAGLMSNMINRIQSLYTSVKSRVKYEMIHMCAWSRTKRMIISLSFFNVSERLGRRLCYPGY